ncbi:MAG: metallophosphoesterase family protein, partial [Actinobacteria bacterium]|nr:metallophosphoesterase family protein [Actinomycetota bacterium]
MAGEGSPPSADRDGDGLARRARLAGRARRLAVVGLVPALLGTAGAWLSLEAFGNDTVAMGPFRVRLASTFGGGRTEIALPPFGRISANTHLAPIHLTATLEDVGLAELPRLLRRRSTQEIVADIERDARASVIPFALRGLAVAAIGAAAAGLLVYRIRWRRVGAAVAGALLVTGAMGGVAWGSYDVAAFRSPTFSGSLRLAADLIGPVRRATERIADFREELERIVGGALRAYTSIEASPFRGDDVVKVLHVSDIHLSPLGMEFARQVAEGFDVDLVIDTGDTTSFGTPAEQFLVDLAGRFDRPYVYVRGNHDALEFQVALDDLRNGFALDGETVRLSGLTIYGLGHPVFTPDQRPPLEDPVFAELARAASERVARDLAELDRPPDIVAVHDDRMVDALAGGFPLVVSGHFHQPSIRLIEGTVFLRIGSTGGSGAGVFTQEGGVPFSAEILYLERGAAEEPARLIGYDLI